MKVFVIMSFDADLYDVYSRLIKTPLEREGYRVSRADDPYEDDVVHENIYDRIVQGLWDSDYVIADLTKYKPNVFYELGIAHTLNKRTIQVSQNLDIPFDIKSYNVISYIVDNCNESELTSRVLEVLRRSEQGKYIHSNIVDDFAKRMSRRIDTVPSARS